MNKSIVARIGSAKAQEKKEQSHHHSHNAYEMLDKHRFTRAIVYYTIDNCYIITILVLVTLMLCLFFIVLLHRRSLYSYSFV
ncbi:hypothetical protein BCT30_01515 [Enterovibrio norvegicus]|nr:hypothetical protein BCU62_06120 [Enterovibrio norvegicus]PMI25668.1 hypothetical protein BCU47_05340 [Enterovibrio norvegicus]PMI32689.1 hypothetical protein BCU46_23005 [Enterovibrio norvegicus]PMN52880.1 hypothetical protein BCT30_01515 [Enterovibrio norvegicus]